MGTDTVAAAMEAVHRRGFLRRLDRLRAAYDGPIHIGHGQTNSQPRTVADMLRLLEVRPGDSILDVGSGSGWTTALLAHLTGPDGRVIGVERVPELVDVGAENLDRAGMPWARILSAEPGTLGAPEHAPYERILVSAQPTGDVPPQLVGQLAAGGRMVIPVRGRLLLVTRTESGYAASEHGWYRFVPLVTED